MVGRQVRVGGFKNPFLDVSGAASDGSVLVTVERQIIHPRYERNLPPGADPASSATLGLVNDFMLLYLAEEPMPNIDSDVVLRLRNREADIEPGTQLSVIGLGNTAATPNTQVFPQSLQELDNMFVVNDNRCGQLRPDTSQCYGAPLYTATQPQTSCGVSSINKYWLGCNDI
jgi:hypothetical protein